MRPSKLISQGNPTIAVPRMRNNVTVICATTMIATESQPFIG
jgi:hypothetical protein